MCSAFMSRADDSVIRAFLIEESKIVKHVYKQQQAEQAKLEKAK